MKLCLRVSVCMFDVLFACTLQLHLQQLIEMEKNRKIPWNVKKQTNMNAKEVTDSEIWAQYSVASTEYTYEL